MFVSVGARPPRGAKIFSQFVGSFSIHPTDGAAETSDKSKSSFECLINAIIKRCKLFPF